MAIPDANTATENWATGMRNAATKIKAGVQASTVNPMAEAAKNLDKYVANTQAAVASGKMARKLNATSHQQWKDATMAKVDRVGTGATAAKPKMQAHLQKFLPHVAAVQQRVKSMPSTTQEDRIARMVANARGIAEFKGS